MSSLIEKIDAEIKELRRVGRELDTKLSHENARLITQGMEYAKQIILSSQKEPCEYCNKTDFTNEYETVFYKSLIDSDCTEECIYIIKSEDGGYELVMNTETVQTKVINFCPMCGRPLNQPTTDTE